MITQQLIILLLLLLLLLLGPFFILGTSLPLWILLVSGSFYLFINI